MNKLINFPVKLLRYLKDKYFDIYIDFDNRKLCVIYDGLTIEFFMSHICKYVGSGKHQFRIVNIDKLFRFERVNIEINEDHIKVYNDSYSFKLPIVREELTYNDDNSLITFELFSGFVWILNNTIDGDIKYKLLEEDQVEFHDEDSKVFLDLVYRVNKMDKRLFIPKLSLNRLPELDGDLRIQGIDQLLYYVSNEDQLRKYLRHDLYE